MRTRCKDFDLNIILLFIIKTKLNKHHFKLSNATFYNAIDSAAYHICIYAVYIVFIFLPLYSHTTLLMMIIIIIYISHHVNAWVSESRKEYITLSSSMPFSVHVYQCHPLSLSRLSSYQTTTNTKCIYINVCACIRLGHNNICFKM